MPKITIYQKNYISLHQHLKGNNMIRNLIGSRVTGMDFIGREKELVFMVLSLKTNSHIL